MKCTIEIFGNLKKKKILSMNIDITIELFIDNNTTG